MTIMPKRRKSKDNPYTIFFSDKDERYMCIFRDNKKQVQIVELNVEVFNALNEFELEDISQMHKIDKHIEHSKLYEGTLNKRMINDNFSSFEEIVERKILIENIKNEIAYLPEIQKRRMNKYFFSDMTMEEIACEERCSKVAVKYSINLAIEKISKKFKI